MLDVIIIGMGISGISSAIYLKRAGLNILMLDTTPGGMTNNIDEIDNLPGISPISGPVLSNNLLDEVKDLDIPYKIEAVTSISLGDTKVVKTDTNKYESKYIVIATGRSPKKLNIPGEEKFLGSGISYCAMCDGYFYKNKKVAVIGGGASALSEAIYLSSICSEVYLIHYKDTFRADHTLINKVKGTSNINIIMNKKVKEFMGNTTLNEIVFDDNTTLDVDGAFIYVGNIPNTHILENTDIKLDNGYIIVDNHGKTNIDKVYACGDVTKKEIYQLITSASEGATVGISISKDILS